ncbi:MAG: glycosyltransferase family 87 protein [Candidatus Omnitrophota bacterium]
MNTHTPKKIDFKTMFMFAALFVLAGYLYDLARALLTSDFYDFGHYYIYARLMGEGFRLWEITPELIARFNMLAREAGIKAPLELVHSTGFLYFVYPFSFLPYKISLVIWVIINQVALLLSVFVLLKDKLKLEPLLFWGGVFLAFSLWGLREDLYLGQPNALLLLFISLAYFNIRKGHYIQAGIFLGLAVQIKEIFLPLLLFFIIRRYWKGLLSAIVVVAIPKSVYTLCFGFGNEVSYWNHIWPKLYTLCDPWDKVNLSIYSIFAKVLLPFAKPELARLLFFIFSLLFLIYITITLIKRFYPEKPNEPLLLAGLVALCFVISPWVHETHYVILIFPLIISWLHLGCFFSRSSFVLFGASYFLIALKYSFARYSLFFTGPLYIFAAGKTYGYILLFILICQLLKKVKHASG